MGQNGYLAGFTWRRRAAVVATALEAAGAADGEVAVIGAPRLARALEQRGRKVSADGAVAGLVAVTAEEPSPEWTDRVRTGGAVVLVAALAPTEIARRALCLGLTDIEQRRAGRLLVISGRVWRP